MPTLPSPPSQHAENAPFGATSPAKPKPPEEPRRAGFDPKALERGAKALCKIDSSPHAKEVSSVSFILLFDCCLHLDCGGI
ncbi:hypothetical protein NL676_033784 [Syzygium grande]|nr:hypothetical protein NL676_033784 [Syzygium grande]